MDNRQTRGGSRVGRSPPVKPRKVTSFTMILYNSENNIDPSNIWTFNLLVHGTCLDL